MAMRRRTFIAAAGSFAASIALRAAGQGAKPVPRVSFLSHSSPREWGSRLAEFRAELRALGDVEGRDVIVETWWAEDRLERIPALIAEMMSSKPTVIVTHGSPNVAALQKATSTVPIVFASAGDPVGQGFVKNYRRPGANITGVAFAEFSPKVYELVKVVIPGVSRTGVLINPDNPTSWQWANIAPSAAKALGFQPLVFKARAREDLERA